MNIEDSYFYIPELKYNQEDLYNCFLNNKNDWARYGNQDHNSLHTKYVNLKEVDYIVKQFKRPEIIDNVKFFKTMANGVVDPHSDNRNVAINIPIRTNDSQNTIFYESKGDYDNPDINLGDKKIITNAKRYNKVEETQRFVLNQPACLNTSLPHGVENLSESDRVILSISFEGIYDSFNKIKSLYKNNLLI
tara:strand:- start:44 stop:616 length:573 start_codon:yes stop_codon:yes gene_type:complete